MSSNEEQENKDSYKEMQKRRAPSYAEVKIESYEIFELTERLKEEGISELPLYTDLSHLNAEKTEEALTNLGQALILLNLHPYFPYPFYAITDKVGQHDQIPVVSSYDDLPKHFNNRIKRLKQKEQLLMNKVKMKSAKLANVSLYDKIGDLRNQFVSQRELLELCQEQEFYTHLIDRLKIHVF